MTTLRQSTETTRRIYKRASKYFAESLANSKTAKNYLRKRGILPSAIEDFNLGYASKDIKGLLENLEEKFDIYDIISSGLFTIKYDSLVPLFENRIVFPIVSKKRIESFTSRSIYDEAPKHKHLSRTIEWFYNERDLVFPIIVVTESPIDTIMFSQIGYPSVATLGTNIKLAEKLSKQSTVYIAFDNDAEGEFNPGLGFAIKFGYEINRHGNAKVMVVEFPTNKEKMDANSFYLSQAQPVRQFKRIIGAARPLDSYAKYWKFKIEERKQREKTKTRSRRRITLDNIKDIPLSEVLREYIDDYQEFDNIIICKCPFHEDSNPSFTIYKESNTFICRGASCGKHGDVIQFVQYADEVEFTEACKRLKEGSYGEGSRYKKWKWL